MTDIPEQPESETAAAVDPGLAELVRLRTRIFLLSPLRKRLARHLARMLGKTAGQDILSTEKLTTRIRIIPLGKMTFIENVISYMNPNLAS